MKLVQMIEAKEKYEKTTTEADSRAEKIKYCPLSFSGINVRECYKKYCAWYDEESGNCRYLAALTEIADQLGDFNDINRNQKK